MPCEYLRSLVANTVLTCARRSRRRSIKKFHSVIDFLQGVADFEERIVEVLFAKEESDGEVYEAIFAKVRSCRRTKRRSCRQPHRRF